MAQLIASYADDKKAEDIVILDMRKVVNFCDYFVICSGTSDRHVRAIADGIEENLKKLGRNIQPKEGTQEGTWVVFDLGDIIAHIFEKDIREFYNLEYLWREAKKVKQE